MSIIEKTRNTNETQVFVSINPYGSGTFEISTPIKFFNHMLELLSAHAKFDLKITANSLDCDPHHLVEDVAITLGQAFEESLGEKRGIARYADIILPMDEALILCAIDVSGRAFCNCDISIKEDKTSDFETVLLAHFFQSFAANARITLHLKMLNGNDPHHIIECTFKAFANALKSAISIDLKNPNSIPSTKGIL